MTPRSCDEVGPLIRETFRAMVRGVERHFGDSELALPQWLTLKLLMEGKIRLMGDVDRELGITSGTSTRLVDQLEAKGLLRRSRSERDRRSVAVALTPEGSRIIRRMQPHLAKFWEDRLMVFSPTELGQLFELLEKLRDSMLCFDQAPAGGA